MTAEKKLALPIGEKQEAYRLALINEAELFAQVEELEHSRIRLNDLLDAAQADRVTAEGIKSNAEAAIKTAAVQGAPVESQTRQTMTDAVATIAEADFRIQALNDELAKLETAKRQINDEIMSGRRGLSWLKADAEREAAIAFLKKMLMNIPDGLPLRAVAERLGCAEHKLAEFAAH